MPEIPEPAEPVIWDAYCAPGRKLAAALPLMLKGERTTEVQEHPYLAGSTDVWLVNPAALQLPEMPFPTLYP